MGKENFSLLVLVTSQVVPGLPCVLSLPGAASWLLLVYCGDISHRMHLGFWPSGAADWTRAATWHLASRAATLWACSLFSSPLTIRSCVPCSNLHPCVPWPQKKIESMYYPAVPRCSVAGSLLARTGASLRLQQLHWQDSGLLRMFSCPVKWSSWASCAPRLHIGFPDSAVVA